MKIIVDTLMSRIKEHNPELNEAQLRTRRFGLEAMVSELSKTLVYLIVFSVFSLTGYFLLSLLVYCSTKALTGGYHAKTYWGCFFVTLIVFIISVLSGRYMQFTVPERTFMLLAALAITLLFAPVKHKNTRAVNIAKADRFKLLSVAFVILWSGLSYLVPDSWGITMAVTVLLEAVMQLAGILFNSKDLPENGVM